MTNKELIEKQVKYLREIFDIKKIDLNNIKQYETPRVCFECVRKNNYFVEKEEIPGHEVLNINSIEIIEPLHYVSFIGFNTKKGPEWYIIDPTYSQFFENKIFKNYMLNHHKDFSIKLLEQGYIEVTLSNILSYINSFTLSNAYTNEIDIEKVYLNLKIFLETRKILRQNDIIKLDEIIEENFHSKQKSK